MQRKSIAGLRSASNYRAAPRKAVPYAGGFPMLFAFRLFAVEGFLHKDNSFAGASELELKHKPRKPILSPAQETHGMSRSRDISLPALLLPLLHLQSSGLLPANCFS